MGVARRAGENDWIVRADTVAAERFIISDATFRKRYAETPDEFDDHPCAAELRAEGFQAYKPRGRLWAFEVTPEMFEKCFPKGEVMAPWRSVTKIEVGDLIACQYEAGIEEGVFNEDAVFFRIQKDAFHE